MLQNKLPEYGILLTAIYRPSGYRPEVIQWKLRKQDIGYSREHEENSRVYMDIWRTPRGSTTAVCCRLLTISQEL